MKSKHKLLESESTIRFLVVRHPLTRFIASWDDIFCSHCTNGKGKCTIGWQKNSHFNQKCPFRAEIVHFDLKFVGAWSWFHGAAEILVTFAERGGFPTELVPWERYYKPQCPAQKFEHRRWNFRLLNFIPRSCQLR